MSSGDGGSREPAPASHERPPKSEERLHEATLPTDEELLRIAGQMARFGGWSVDLEEGVVHWSDEVCAIHGVPPGTTVAIEEGIEYYAPRWRPLIRERFDACIERGEPFDLELQVIAKGGHEVWVRTIGEPVRGPDGEIVGARGAFQDISARKRAESERDAVEHRLVRTLETMLDAFFTLDHEWRFTFVNEEGARMLERDADELVGTVIWDSFPEARGSTFQREYERAMSEGRRVRFEELYPPLGRWFRVSAYPSAEGLAVYFQDVTERKELEEQLRHSQKIEAVGRLSGGIAHDFNNLLTVIGAATRMTLDDLPPDAQVREHLREILGETERGARLTRQLLAFSRRQVLEKRVLELGGLLAGMRQMLRKVIPERIRIHVSAADRPLWIETDPDQLRQVVLNLVLNAADAIEREGTIHIELGTQVLGPGEADRIPWHVVPGEYVRLEVRDTGAGMTNDVREQVFDPFFTTKTEGRGTGLGLSMVYGMVKQSGGHIFVESEPGVGTTFRILLPSVEPARVAELRSEDPLSSDAPGESSDRGAGRGTGGARGRSTGGATGGSTGGATGGSTGGAAGHSAGQATERSTATVLLVEDEPSVRNVAARLLKRFGYAVIEAGGAVEALDLAQRHGREIDVVLSDLVMPEMDGARLLEHLRRSRPELGVVLMTGYSEHELGEEARRQATRFLQKPFSPEELGDAVRAALGVARG